MADLELRKVFAADTRDSLLNNHVRTIHLIQISA